MAGVEASLDDLTNTTTNSHYDALGTTYEDAFFYEAGEYNNWMLDRLSENLKLDDACQFVDIGGGTGHIAEALGARFSMLKENITVVEPSESMSSKATERGLKTEVADGVCWALSNPQDEGTVQRVLMKEVIHHIPVDKRTLMWNSILNKLSSGGVVCIVTRPQNGIDYPFFEAAHQVWKDQSSPVSDLTNDLEAVGFKDVRVDLKAYPCKISVDRWVRMVRNRFWSTFDSFDDSELEQGCEEIKAKYKLQEEIEFEDRLLFVVAFKP